jgi:hypothetical protein
MRIPLYREAGAPLEQHGRPVPFAAAGGVGGAAGFAAACPADEGGFGAHVSVVFLSMLFLFYFYFTLI